jgi:hypothetical protein
MSMFNRRSIFGVIGAAPLAAQGVAGAIAGGLSSFPPSHPYPENAATQSGQLISTPQPPRMSRPSAMRTIFGDKDALAEIRDELFRENRVIAGLDPDIAIMKSWSPMAKITFQRQRNVDLALARLQDAQSWDRSPGMWVRAIEDRLQKLMWGT